GTEQAVLVRQAEFAVIDPSDANRGASNDICAILEIADPLAGDDFTADTGAGNENFRAEPACLLAGPLGEVRATDALRKTQIILDLRTAAGLSTDCIAFNYDGFETLRSAIDSRAQPSRPGPIDRKAVLYSRGILIP